MILLPAYSGKSVGVFGLGKSGCATARALAASDANVYAWDDGTAGRDVLQDDENIALLDYTDWPWQELETLVLSPGVPLHFPQPHPVAVLAKEHDVRIIGDVELLLTTYPQATTIAITGTNGKSTTTALIGHILQKCDKEPLMGGNLGTPVLQFNVTSTEPLFVLELSSYQLDLLQESSVDIACLLNITPDHLDRHGGMDGYVAAKQSLFNRIKPDGAAVIGVDDVYCQKIAVHMDEQSTRCITVSAQQAPLSEAMITVRDGTLQDHELDESFSASIKPIKTLRGKHNWQNAGVAYAAVRQLGLKSAEILQAMTSFAGLNHRMEWVCKQGGVTFVNDSKATNAEAAANALAAYDEIYWIVGGKAKEGGIASLQPFFGKIRHAYLIGECSEQFAATLQDSVAYSQCITLENATRQAYQSALKESAEATILLCPAAASFDQWPSFEARGDAFKAYVKQVTGIGEAA